MIGPPHRMRPVAAGETVRLECSVQNADFYTWSVRLARRPSRSKLLSMLIDRRMTGATERVLQIVRLDLDDAGNFTCETISGYPNSHPEYIRFELNVYDQRLENILRPDPRRCKCSLFALSSFECIPRNTLLMHSQVYRFAGLSLKCSA